MTEKRLPIVGSGFHPGAIDKLRTLTEGVAIQLVRDYDNRHDSQAVACYADGQMLGYIPRNQNTEVAQALSGGITVSATLCAAALIQGPASNALVREPARIMVRWE